MVKKKKSWHVRLGQPEWARHTYPRPKSDALSLLGSVQSGLQIGALAKDENGEYYQVVGDFITPLNRRKIEAAVTKASSAKVYSDVLIARKKAPPTVVTVKRRRIPVLA